MVPQIEAEFAQLNRDYDINKKNYETLVARRESAEISGDMEATSGVADFRLIDPPRVSPQPVAPNRLLLFPLALLGALGAGLFASFAASQMWPTFFDSRSLRETTRAAGAGRGVDDRRASRRSGASGAASSASSPACSRSSASLAPACS